MTLGGTSPSLSGRAPDSTPPLPQPQTRTAGQHQFAEAVGESRPVRTVILPRPRHYAATYYTRPPEPLFADDQAQPLTDSTASRIVRVRAFWAEVNSRMHQPTV